MKSILTVKPGMRFGRLTAVEEVGRDKHGQSKWLFRCDCGKEKIIIRYSVVKGRTKSCGCLNYEVNKSGNNRRTHGETNTRLYGIWQAMKSRCNAPIGSNNWKWYSSKGITVCDEWKEYKPFRDWALNNGYNDTLTIDRIDSNGDYEPSNCRWATLAEQANNKSTNRIITYNNETHTLREWSDITHINYSMLATRYWRGDRGDQLFRAPERLHHRKAVNS